MRKLINVAAATMIIAACGSSTEAGSASSSLATPSVTGVCGQIRGADNYNQAVGMKVDGINAGLSASAIMAECGDLLQPHTATTLAYVAAADWEVECPGPSSVQVVYNGGSGNGDVDYTAAMATGTQQGSSVQLPLLMRGDHAPIGLHFCAPPGQFVYLSLQGTQSISAVRCVIDVDGIRISSNESHGAYTIASCDGQA